MKIRSTRMWSSIGVGTLTVAAAATGLMASGAGAADRDAAAAGAQVIQEKLASGGDVLVYVPGGDKVGFRAASTPILLVLSDAKITTGQAQNLATSSGLASIAEREQGVVAFLNPSGTNWQKSDTAAFAETLTKFSDNTGAPYDQNGKQCSRNPATGATACSYPGSKTRVYLFADRAGADFVNQHVVPGIPIPTPFPGPDGQPMIQTWTPTAVWSANATKTVTAPSVPVEVPAFVVNGSAQIRRAYSRLNQKHQLFGTASAPTNQAFTRRAISTGYNQVLEHAIQRTSEVNPFLQTYRIPDFAAEGIAVTHASPVINGAPLEYFRYRPKPATRGRVPLVMVFHGGGNHAEYQIWATGWASLAKQYGFQVVSVNRHVERTAADVVGLLDQLVAKDPSIDTSRIYASGFSMGSVKTWALGEEFTKRFAAIAPMSGSFGPSSATASGLMPTIYFGGQASPLPEFPHQKFVIIGPGGESNDIDIRLKSLFARNDVTANYEYDAAADELWGIAPASTYTVRDREFSDVSVTVGNYPSADGKTYTALGAVANGSHEPLPVEARLAWDFMSHFSRSKDGAVVLKGTVR